MKTRLLLVNDPDLPPLAREAIRRSDRDGALALSVFGLDCKEAAELLDLERGALCDENGGLCDQLAA